MKILYIPLDERPCNYMFPQMVNQTNEDHTLVIPDISLLGDKKKSADIDGLWNFVESNIAACDAAVLSIDTLLFGGLIPSRVHHLSYEVVDGYFKRLSRLKERSNKTKIYAFECIMRSPSYDSSEEEPDYYATDGFALYRKAYLNDKKYRFGITDAEEHELNSIEIASAIQSDYESRRSFNLNYNLQVASLVKSGQIDFLVIPQDDSSEFGYTAIAQKQVIAYLSEHKLEAKIRIYPGADEVGCSLIARCLNDYLDRDTKVFAFYSSILGPTIVANYEDRPLHENLKYHLDVTRSYLVDRPEDADFILAINAPGKVMEEAFDQKNKDVSYTSFRNLAYFCKEIERLLAKGFPVAICDSAFSNGGDIQLIDYLDQDDLLPSLQAYGGWNTNSNTLGTVLSTAIYSYDKKDTQHQYQLVYRILEDVLYQADIRQDIINHYLIENGLSYYDFKDKQRDVEAKIEELLQLRYNELKISKALPIHKLKVTLPWRRMFELGLEFEIIQEG